jgi:hypothetical protein
VRRVCVCGVIHGLVTEQDCVDPGMGGRRTVADTVRPPPSDSVTVAPHAHLLSSWPNDHVPPLGATDVLAEGAVGLAVDKGALNKHASLGLKGFLPLRF